MVLRQRVKIVPKHPIVELMGSGHSTAAGRPQFFSTSAEDADTTAAALIARLRRQLASSEEMATIGRMTTGIAQELNNPLTSLLGSLSQMTDLVGRGEGPPSIDDAVQLRIALRDCESVVDRIKDLVGAIRGISHRDPRNTVFFDPARAIRNATKIFAVVNHQQCRIDLTISALPALHGSPTRLGQVILNLLQNGLDASLRAHHDRRARLAVVATATDTEVRLSVADDGAGIPDEIAPHLFDEFVTSKDTEDGRGLGLHLSRQFVSEMRGSIEFESAPGKTVFTVRLPFVD
jgi:two-component system C4-dicarboxylate transport sensor histidine kinase DctB